MALRVRCEDHRARNTGFIVDTEDEAARAVLNLPQIDRRAVRQVFEERFTANVMARNYLRLYWRLCGAAGAKRSVPETPYRSLAGGAVKAAGV